MNVKSAIKQAAFKRHVQIAKLDAKKELEEFLARFREKYVSCNLVRIGGDGDGGYLAPNIFGDVKYCFSPGVDHTANFEKELSEKYNIKSFMADASVQNAPMQDKNFEFIPKFLGSFSKNQTITLSDWIRDSIEDDKSQKILQMDIEGSEYDVLIIEDSDALASFSTMIIEFHKLEKLFERDFLKIFSTIFEKIYKNFSVCHVHPNNCCGVAELDGISVPRVIEVTFIRNDLVLNHQNMNKIILPHALDRKNTMKNEDLNMPEIWWKP